MTAIGIDLGTTNSVVTKGDADPSQVALIPVGGRRSTPSVVGMRESGGKPDVGAPALNFARRDATNTILSVKRLMGRDFADPEVAKTQQRRSYQVVPGSDTDPRAHVVMFGRKYTPAEISTLILRRLKEGAEQKLRTEVTHAVITVPAYFHETQRAATREAGEQAGLVVKRIIDEPTAAAVAFGLELQQDQRHRILVYDLGGGTFDISILNAVKDTEGHNHFQVLAYTGDNWLGGDDFDQLIVTRIIKWVKENAGLDPSSDPEFLFHAKQAAEDAKCQLSEAVEHDIIIPAAVRGPAGYVDVDMKLTRHDFEALITPSVDRTIDLVRKALDEQNQKPDDISDVLLVGGSTMIPKVYQAVEAFFGREKVRRSVDPMECVTIGAGILAGTLHGVQCQSCKTVNDESAEKCTQCGQSLVSAPSAGETHVYDVTGMSLGVAAVKGNRTDVFVPIIPKNTPYPMSEPMRQTFEATSGRLIRVPVYEGDSPVASQNQEQGVIEYELDEEIDIHTRVEVAFLFNRNRELRVTISVPGTNLTHQRELRVDTPRTQPPASEAADEDTTHREELVNVDWAAQRFLEGFEQYLKPEQAMRIRNHRQEAQQVLVFSEPAECRRVTSLLENDILGSGLASELYLAERAEERATREERPQITAAIAAVRKSFQDGNHAAAREQAVVLKAMVARVLVRNNVPVLEDGESYDGLLKLLDKSQP